MSKLNTPAFLTAYKSDAATVATKSKLVGKAVIAGMSVADIATELQSALTVAGLIVPKSFTASVQHYATAYATATLVTLTGHDAAIHAAYQISTGAIKSADRAALVSTFNEVYGLVGSKFDTPAKDKAEAFRVACRTAINKARADKLAAAALKNGGQPPTVTPRNSVDPAVPGAVNPVTVTPESGLSVEAEIGAMLKRLRANADSMAGTVGGRKLALALAGLAAYAETKSPAPVKA